MQVKFRNRNCILMAMRNQFISSRFVKEIHFLKGDVKSFIPKNVFVELKKINK